MKNGSFLYDLCTKNLQIYGQRAPQNVLAAAYFFAILPNCQHPEPNCAASNLRKIWGQFSLKNFWDFCLKIFRLSLKVFFTLEVVQKFEIFTNFYSTDHKSLNFF